jgi:polysaccharide export outer membrane protein
MALLAATSAFGATLVAPLVNADTLAAVPAAKPVFPLGTGDVVTVQVYGRPELTTTTYVAEDGTITMPLAGPVIVAGLSPTVAAQQVAAAFRTGQFLRNPDITLLVTESHSQQVSVLGEVKAPGRFAVQSTTNVLDILALAGGTTDRGANTVFLIRADQAGRPERHAIDLKGLQNGQYPLQLVTLQGGDSIYVPPEEQFYIYGEVRAPNMYRLEPSMTVLQAISRGGGLTTFASNRRMEIKRKGADGVLATLKARLDTPVLANDVIYIKETLF